MLENFTLRHIRGIEEAGHDVAGNVLVLVEGARGVGKSSLLEGLRWAIDGGTAPAINDNGKKAVGEVMIDGISIKRAVTERGTKTLEVTASDGTLVTGRVQDWINDAIGKCADMCPERITDADPKDQAAILLSMYGMQADVEALDAEIIKSENQRRDVNRTIKTLSPVVDRDAELLRMVEPSPEAVEEARASFTEAQQTYTRRIREREALRTSVSHLREKKASTNERVAELQREIRERQAQLAASEEILAKVDEDLVNAVRQVEDTPEPTPPTPPQILDDFEEYDRNRERIKQAGDDKVALNNLQIESEELTESIQDARRKRIELLSAIPGITIDDDGNVCAEFGGKSRRLNEFSTSEQILIACKVFCSAKDRPPFVWIGRGESLGKDGLPLLYQYAKETQTVFLVEYHDATIHGLKITPYEDMTYDDTDSESPNAPIESSEAADRAEHQAQDVSVLSEGAREDVGKGDHTEAVGNTGGLLGNDTPAGVQGA